MDTSSCLSEELCITSVSHSAFALSGLGKLPWNVWLLLHLDCCGEFIRSRGGTDMTLKRYGAHTRFQGCVEKHKGEDKVIHSRGTTVKGRI